MPFPSNFIAKQKKLYKKLAPCYCQAIQETVHFTSEGLNHLLYYRRRPRSYKERQYRASIIPYLMEVIINANQAKQTIETNSPKMIITWSLQHEVKATDGKQDLVKVILKKEGAGNVILLSAMKKKRRKRKANKKAQGKP